MLAGLPFFKNKSPNLHVQLAWTLNIPKSNRDTASLLGCRLSFDLQELYLPLVKRLLNLQWCLEENVGLVKWLNSRRIAREREQARVWRHLSFRKERRKSSWTILWEPAVSLLVFAATSGIQETLMHWHTFPTVYLSYWFHTDPQCHIKLSSSCPAELKKKKLKKTKADLFANQFSWLYKELGDCSIPYKAIDGI